MVLAMLSARSEADNSLERVRPIRFDVDGDWPMMGKGSYGLLGMEMDRLGVKRLRFGAMMAESGDEVFSPEIYSVAPTS